MGLDNLIDSKYIIKKFFSYIKFEENYFKKETTKDENTVVLDFESICQYDLDLGDFILENAEESIMLFQNCLKEEFQDDFQIKLENVPTSENVVLNEIRTSDVGRLVAIRGMVKRKSDRFSKLDKLYYLCINPSCSYSENKISVPQTDDTMSKIKSCPKCKSGVELIQTEEIDFQTYHLEEMSEDLSNSNIQPKTKLVQLHKELTSPLVDNNLPVGSKIEVIGIIKKKTKKHQNKDLVISDFYIEANNIIPLEENIYDISVSKNELQEIYSLSKQEDFKTKIVSSFAPHLMNIDRIKEGCILSLLGGTEGNDTKRDKIHILAVGDPSMGKSQILKFIKILMPRTKYVSGEGSTGSGLTATAQKDELSGGWTAEAGAIVQANNGQLLIDELDKIPRYEQTKLNTALESGRVVLDKASVSVDLKANATVIACANPKYGKFDNSKDYGEQLKLDSALRTRFDLIYILEDKQNEENDIAVADSVFDIEENDTLSVDFLRKYLITAKKLKPKHTKETAKILKEYYVKLRKETQGQKINITVRQLDGLKRLSEAHAKLHLREEVMKQDCDAVIELLNYCQKDFGVYEQTMGIQYNTMNKNKALMSILSNLPGEFTIEQAVKKLKDENSPINQIELEEKILKLKQDGEIMEPRRGIYLLL